MQDHIRLSSYLALLTNNLYELSKWEWTANWPLCDPDNETLLLKSFWLLCFHKYLRQLAVVWHENSVVGLHLILRDPIHLCKFDQFCLCLVKHLV